MRIAFLVQDLQLSGGVGVVVEHASQLNRRHGFACHLVVTRPSDRPAWAYRGLADVPVLGLDEAVDGHFDVAVATWWETCLDLFKVSADRHAYFLQLLEDSTYPLEWPERTAAAMTLAMPVRFITEARWIAGIIETMQPGTAPFYVRNGIPKDVFVTPDDIEPALDGPLKVVVEGSRALAHKGVDDALDAAALMREPHEVTLVTGNPGSGAPPNADHVVTGISHPEMAALLRTQHVMLKLSRAEGMYGPPLESFHMGATVVTTPVTGFDEYIRHRHNGLVVGWDDPHGTARALDLLAKDRGLLHELRANALETARAWPSWELASDEMGDALRAIHREPPPDPRPAGLRLGAEMATNLAEHQRRHLIEQAYELNLEAIRAQRAFKVAQQVRRGLVTARRARGKAVRIVTRRP